MKKQNELTNTQMVEYLCKEDENKNPIFSLDDSPEKSENSTNSLDSLFLRESQPVNYEEIREFPQLHHTQKEEDTNWWKNSKSKKIKKETKEKTKQKTLDEFRTPKRKREESPKKLERISISSEETSPNNNEISPSIIVPESQVFIKPPEFSVVLDSSQKKIQNTQWSWPQWKDEFGDSIDFNNTQKYQMDNQNVDQYLNIDMLKSRTPSPMVGKKEIEIPSNISSPLYEKQVENSPLDKLDLSKSKNFIEETQLPDVYENDEEKPFLEESQIPEKIENEKQEEKNEKVEEKVEEKVQKETKLVEKVQIETKKSKETKKKKELKDGDITKYMVKKKPEIKSPKKKKRKVEIEEDSLESFEKCALCLSIAEDYPQEIKDQLKEMIGPIEHKEYGYKLYLHENCAIYTPEVYQEKNGEYKNLKKAIDRGRRTVCSYCKKRGGTIGCKVEDCKKVYHFPCALKVEGKFENFEFSCPKHK